MTMACAMCGRPWGSDADLWQPMSSAPMTGETVILMLDDGVTVTLGYFDLEDEDGPAWSWFHAPVPSVPTAWQPLPKPKPAAPSLPMGGR